MGMCSDGRKRDNGGRLGKGMEGCTSGKTLPEGYLAIGME